MPEKEKQRIAREAVRRRDAELLVTALELGAPLNRGKYNLLKEAIGVLWQDGVALLVASGATWDEREDDPSAVTARTFLNNRLEVYKSTGLILGTIAALSVPPMDDPTDPFAYGDWADSVQRDESDSETEEFDS